MHNKTQTPPPPKARLFPYPYITLTAIAVALLIVAVSGCHPYFNTFYNAEEAFQIAQREHRKLLRVYPDSIVVAPSKQSEAFYDRAIEKTYKMMDVFPRDEKYQDRAHYLMGRSLFYMMNFQLSLGRMSDLQALYPESPLVPPSRLYAAKAHIMLDNLSVAEEILIELLRDHPQLDRNQQISMLLVEIAIRRGGRSHALGLLEGMNRSSLSLDRRINVILRMAELNYELRQYEAALVLLRSSPRDRKMPRLMYRIDRLMYFCYDATDSLDAALEHLRVMQRNRRYHERRYEIMYYRAVTLHRMGRFDEAMALLDDIRHVCEARAGQPNLLDVCGPSSYLLARIYEEMGNRERAEAMFEDASKVSGPEAARASARLMALRRLRDLRTPDSLGNISPDARYMIAELFSFELEAPDSAYAYFMELSADTAAVSMRPRALLAAGFVAKNQLDNPVGANSLFETVAGEYVGTEYARRAQIELGVEVTFVTERERAERAFRDAEALLGNDPVQAIKAFYNVYIDYPDEPIASRSLHAAAWNTDNVLHRNRAALALYEELCERFPDSEYCMASAAPRLIIARDSIEVRRQRREAAATPEDAAEPESVIIETDVSEGDADE
ncbi:MAG: hypothetical protein LBU70_09670 [Chitinispirillales bacterium]|jgi:TolA-binding protein|nr:hypothetical protein [Chitinispirillales bacterium]